MQRTRTTLRRRKQRGGATWYKIDASRLQEWATATVYDNERAEVTMAELFPLHFGPAGDKSALMEEHFKILERQDDLFNTALGLIQKKVRATLNIGTTTAEIVANAGAIDAITAWVPYLTDVEGLVNLAIDTTEDAEQGLTKLQSVKKESLATLLLFPSRINNMFVQLLANVLIVLKSSDVLTTLTSDSLINIATDQYKANVEGNAYLQTARALRDGFYLGQGEKDFLEDIKGKGFWKKLFEKLVAIKNGTYTPAAFLEETETSWIDVTAKLFAVYVSDGIDPATLLGKMIEGVTPIGEGRERRSTRSQTKDRQFRPDPEYDTITVRGMTYGSIMSHIRDETLQFILHLAYTIRRNELDVKGALAIKAEMPSS